MMDPLDIVLIEDNHDIAENIVLYLEGKKHRVEWASTGNTGLTLLTENRYDVALLDVMLPNIDGFTLAIKARHSLAITTPILFLTARDTLDDKLQGFTSGGDDYLTKPFAMEEMEARLLALVRRATGLVTDTLKLDCWTVHTKRFQIHFQDQPLKTTKIGFKIFKALVSAYPNVVLRSEIENLIWGEDPPDSDALRSHMFSLRKAIGFATKSPVIETVHGIGFRLNV
ncbi:MAG: response regulator transcription factor [Pseudomonadota bacterium]